MAGKSDGSVDPMVLAAIEFAVKAHSNQPRKATNIPYITHPLGVAQILLQYGLSCHIAVAGVLHDTVEDSGATLDTIRQKFGPKVAELVEGASESNRDHSWEDRKKHTIEYLKTAPMEVVYISCADKLDNVISSIRDYRILGERFWERFNRSKERQRWYHTRLSKVFLSRAGESTVKGLFEEYASKVEELFGKAAVT